MADIETTTSDALPVITEPTIDITGTNGVENVVEAGTGTLTAPDSASPTGGDPESTTDRKPGSPKLYPIREVAPGKYYKEIPVNENGEPTFYTKKIGQMTTQLSLAERRAQELEDRLRELETKSRASPSTSDKPKREDFFDPDEYDAALIEHATAEAERRLEAKLAQSAEKQAQQAQVTQIQKTWQEQVESAKSKHADFEEVVYADDFQCSPAMMQALVEEKHGAEVAYHLATNPDENARIVALSPIRQAIEIGKLAVTIAAPPKVSKAPPPIKPLGNQAPAVDKDPADESEAEYFARRTAQARATRERMF